jgi:hypothetical protein
MRGNVRAMKVTEGQERMLASFTWTGHYLIAIINGTLALS